MSEQNVLSVVHQLSQRCTLHSPRRR